MKIFLQNVIIILVFTLNYFPCSSQSNQFAVQDFVIIDSLNIDSSGVKINLTNRITQYILAHPKDTIVFSGGAEFITSDSIKGKAIDIDLVPIYNTTSVFGVLHYGTSNYFSFLTTSDLNILRETIGNSDMIDIDLTNFYPSTTAIGDSGVISYVFLQFIPHINSSIETGLSNLDLANLRANDNLYRITSANSTGSEVTQFTHKFVVAQGSKSSRHWMKTLAGLGTGGIAAATGGLSLIATIGIAAVAFFELEATVDANNEGDDTPDPFADPNKLPSADGEHSLSANLIETTSSFTLIIRGAGLDHDATFNIGLGQDWTIQGSIEEDAGFFNDILYISGIDIRHFMPPHSEGPNPNGFDLQNTSSASDLTIGNNTIIFPTQTFIHGLHRDSYTSVLIVSVAQNKDDILGFTLTIRGKHAYPMPTLSQWGLIIFTLMLLAVGMVFVQRRQNALVLAGDVPFDSAQSLASLFEKSLYFKVLGIVLLLAVTGLLVSYFYYGELTKTDTVGTLVSVGIVTYMVQLWLLMRRK